MARTIPCPQEDNEPCTNPECRIGLCQLEEKENREQAAVQEQWKVLYSEELHRLKEEAAKEIMKKRGLRLTKENIGETLNEIRETIIEIEWDPKRLETLQRLERLAREHASYILSAVNPITLESVIAYCRSNRRVCPQPMWWDELYRLLKNTAAGHVDLPFILGAWWHTSDATKQVRLAYHIRLAQEFSVLDQVDALLRSLPEREMASLR